MFGRISTHRVTMSRKQRDGTAGAQIHPHPTVLIAPTIKSVCYSSIGTRALLLPRAHEQSSQMNRNLLPLLHLLGCTSGGLQQNQAKWEYAYAARLIPPPNLTLQHVDLDSNLTTPKISII
uniref:Uncharacterized protein n=1 Tax=Sphaerodactylus townsendi TaxID=933632 RepID=A0ACB8FVQ6_9SAUR